MVRRFQWASFTQLDAIANSHATCEPHRDHDRSAAVAPARKESGLETLLV
jgi:hypothetical protein